MQVISTGDAPAAIGPYSQAVRQGDFIFVSGQLPIHPVTGVFDAADIGAQCRQCLTNVAKILEAAGSGLDCVLKTTVMLTDLSRFDEVNAVYAGFFGETRPARATFEVSALPKGVSVEIEAVAVVRRAAG